MFEYAIEVLEDTIKKNREDMCRARILQSQNIEVAENLDYHEKKEELSAAIEILKESEEK